MAANQRVRVQSLPGIKWQSYGWLKLLCFTVGSAGKGENCTDTFGIWDSANYVKIDTWKICAAFVKK